MSKALESLRRLRLGAIVRGARWTSIPVVILKDVVVEEQDNVGRSGCMAPKKPVLSRFPVQRPGVQSFALVKVRRE